MSMVSKHTKKPLGLFYGEYYDLRTVLHANKVNPNHIIYKYCAQWIKNLTSLRICYCKKQIPVFNRVAMDQVQEWFAHVCISFS